MKVSEKKLRNIKLVLEYDGARYSGFQRQPGKPTIQSEFEKALKKLFGKRTKIAAASGRTDAGVHASHQVVSLRTASTLALTRIQPGLNHYLPQDIAVIAIAEAPQKFHARFSAKSKVYEYRIWNSRIRSPLRAMRTYHVPYALDLKAMQAAAAHLVGKHDFSAFCSTGSGRRDPVRRVKKLTLRRTGDEIVMRIEADGFLYHMVRTIAGTLVEAGRGKRTAAEVKALLEPGTVCKAGPNAPGHALTLAKVSY